MDHFAKEVATYGIRLCRSSDASQSKGPTLTKKATQWIVNHTADMFIVWGYAPSMIIRNFEIMV